MILVKVTYNEVKSMLWNKIQPDEFEEPPNLVGYHKTRNIDLE